MKSSLTPQQLQWVGLSVFGLLVAGVINWFGLSTLGEAQNEALAFADRLGKPGLGAVLQRPEGAAGVRKEVEQLQQITREIESVRAERIAPWEQATLEMAGDGKDWSTDPGKWKDELIARQNRYFKRSAEEPENRKVILANDFYLGLEAYRQKSPSPQETPELAMQLMIASRLVEILMESRKARENYPTLCRLKSLASPSSRAEKNPELSAEPHRILPLFFDLELEVSPEVLMEFVRNISQSPIPFLVRAIEVKNEQQIFPTRSEIRKGLEGEDRTEDNSQNGALKKKLLLVLAGKEKLEVKISVEFVPWKNPATISPTPPAT